MEPLGSSAVGQTVIAPTGAIFVLPDTGKMAAVVVDESTQPVDHHSGCTLNVKCSWRLWVWMHSKRKPEE